MTPFRVKHLVCAAQVLAAASIAYSQETVLRSGQVTESALIDALAPESPGEPASDVRTRGLRPMLIAPHASGNVGRASLLITFRVNEAELTPEAKAILDTLAKAMQSDRLARLAFRVEGHADPRGPTEHNQTLSQLRAESVVVYLRDRHGISAERMTAVGKGSIEPLDTVHPDAPENRRVTIVTLGK